MVNNFCMHAVSSVFCDTNATNCPQRVDDATERNGANAADFLSLLVSLPVRATCATIAAVCAAYRNPS